MTVWQNVVLHSGLAVEQCEVGWYILDFHRGGKNLVITFESGDPTTRRNDALREAWYFSFLASRGFSVLGVKPRSPNWYRGEKLLSWFRSTEFAGLLADFSSVAFMGGSMGGFAALTFSRVAPGAMVVAHNPQSTLRPELTLWDQRFPQSQAHDWSGDFADAADAAPLARRIYVTYDPFLPTDKQHVDRFDGGNVVHLKMPFLGHGAPVWLKSLGLLDEMTERALDETLTSEGFGKLIRRRRSLPRYYDVAANRLVQVCRPRAAQLFRAAGVRLLPKIS